MKSNNSLFESVIFCLSNKLRLYRLPFFSALVFGFLGHMYAFTNKLLNADEISALFTKGATVTSGRWGLELTKLLFPDVSMPWIYGLISLILLSAAACVVISAFEIKSPVFRCLLSGLMVCFPAIVGNFCFMFTSAPYALAILGACLAVWLFIAGGRLNCAGGVVILAVSLGIYQAYISLAASLLVLSLLRMLLEGEKALPVLKRGIRYVLLLLVSLLVYYGVTFAVDSFSGKGYQEYEFMSTGGIISSVLRAYSSFAHTLSDGYFGYVNSGLSVAAHLVCLGLCAAFILKRMIARRDASALLLAILLLGIFPLSINCMYLIASVDIIHSLVLYGFVSIYVMAALVFDSAESAELVFGRLISLALAFIVAGNIFYSNKVYLKMALQYENAYAFYNSLLVQIMETPGFNENTVVDFVGSESWGIKEFDEIDTSMLTGPNDELVNIYTRVYFMKYYLGLDLYSYREDIIYADWYYDMPSWPDPGSIFMQPEENRIIIKLQ